MKILHLTPLALLVGSSMVFALPCDGFKLNVKNNLADNLVVTSVKLDKADLTPGGIQNIEKKTEQPFVVNNSPENSSFKGQFVFHTLSLPSKKIKINFELENKGLICEYTALSQFGDYTVNTARLPGQVDFTIENQ